MAGGGIEIADVDREHRDVAVAVQNWLLLPKSVLVDRRQRPLRAGVIHVSPEQLELRVEVVLDAAQRLEPIPRQPSHLVHRVGIPALLRPGRRGLQRAVGWGSEVVKPSSLATVPPVPAARSVEVMISAAGASTATTV